MIKELMAKLIEEKYLELQGFKQGGAFSKIFEFEGNATGQIGEKFIKKLFEVLNLSLDDTSKEIIHDEFDLLSKGKKIEVKTARKGLKNNTFQFNDINPKYNYDYIILLGLTYDELYFYIIDKKRDYLYEHKTRKEFIKIDNKLKQLVMMNPGNAVNLKLSLNLTDLKSSEDLADELRALFA